MITPLRDQDQRGESDRGLWTSLEQAVGQDRPITVDLWQSLKGRLDFSQKKPRRIAGVEVAFQPSSQGEGTYVLKSPVPNSYLKLDARDYFLWEQMDGEHSIRDLAVAYFTKYGAFPFERLMRLLAQLKASCLLEEKLLDVFGAATAHFNARRLAYRLQRFAETATQKEFSLKNADAFFDALFKRAGWLFFTRPARFLYAVLTPAGLALFLWLLLGGAYPLFSSAGSYGLGLLVLMLANYVMIFFHECGHALAIKNYGRHVPKAGILLYFGGLAPFVDATDTWMAPKRARIVVSFAGPLATILFGNLMALSIALYSAFSLNPVLFQVAFVCYFGAFMNLLPLLECDGYFVLMDLLEIPMLRKKALAFLKESVVDKLKARSPFNREEKILASFGLLSAVSTGLIVVFAVYMWQSRVMAMLGELASGRDPLSTVLAGGLMILVGAPLVLGLGIRGLLLAGNLADRARRMVSP
ncbi:MAG: M50 family metallopeptidase [Ardenticatenaceae bacterium]|nr:M50 family metallopeptidase [Ardenticatenaceae bacterium]